MQAQDFQEGFPGRLVPTEGGVVAYVPNPLPPAIRYDATFAKRLGAARAAVGRLEGALSGGKVSPFLISYPLMQREAVYSNRIEGTYTTPVELALFDLKAPVQQQEAAQATQTRDVSNYVTAMQKGLVWLGEPTNLPICNRLMKKIHGVLVADSRGENKRPGDFRTRQNYIGREADGIEAARFVPPPPREMERAMEDLQKYINEQVGPDSETDAFLSIALVHYQFETIHPFMDGNGRLGRLLVPLMFVERKILTQPLLHVSSTLDKRQAEYRELMLAVSQRGAWQEWMLFFLLVIEEAAKEALSKAESLGALYNDYQSKVRTRRASGLLGRLIDRLFQQPSISITEAAKVMEVSYAQAAEHVHRLETLGILKELTQRDRYKRFAAIEVLSKIFE